MSEREQRPGGTEEIIRKIGAVAASYTPEWDFNPESPDIGSALALVYADMLGETARQMDRLGYKNQLAFFGSLGAERKPAVPANLIFSRPPFIISLKGDDLMKKIRRILAACGALLPLSGGRQAGRHLLCFRKYHGGAGAPSAVPGKGQKPAEARADPDARRASEYPA